MMDYVMMQITKFRELASNRSQNQDSIPILHRKILNKFHYRC